LNAKPLFRRLFLCGQLPHVREFPGYANDKILVCATVTEYEDAEAENNYYRAAGEPVTSFTEFFDQLTFYIPLPGKSQTNLIIRQAITNSR
jgi:hypothetical protein